MIPANGYPIVLTADRTLIAGYRLLFDGMLSASQTTTTPKPLMDAVLMPRAQSHDGRAVVAPLGLRRIEAALLAGGFTPDEVAVVAPDGLKRAIGPATRIVAVSAGEPTGRGMNSSTMAGIAGGRIYPLAMFQRLMRDVRRLVSVKAPGAKVMMGGPGAWQLGQDEAARRDLGIDHVVCGYAEANAAELFRALLADDKLPATATGECPCAENIPPIRGASTMGVVEISRGCGLGCSFCTISRVPMIHVPVETILSDARTNAAAGMQNIALLSEDFFRYGGRGAKADPGALLGMLERVRRIEGLRLIQVDHANVVSIAQFADDELRAARELLVGRTGSEYPWVNVGIETASGELLRANGGGAKIGARPAGDWAQLCAEQVRRLCRAGFFPLTSLVLGLPGETPEDVRRTLEWVRSLEGERISVFPMLLAPVDGAPAPGAGDLSQLHWELIRASYRLNFRWTPRMYWDNQAAAGVSLWRRLLIQALGWGQVAEWSALFAWRAARAKNQA